MNRTLPLRAPIVSILSPSLASSKKAISLLSVLGNLEQVTVLSDDSILEGERLNDTFKSSIPGFSRSWDAVGAKCPISGSILHFCSLGYTNMTAHQNRGQRNPFSLIGITDIDQSELKDGSEVRIAMSKFRKLVTSQLSNLKAIDRAYLDMKFMLNGNVKPQDLGLDGSQGGLPILSLPSESNFAAAPGCTKAKSQQKTSKLASTYLKEIVVPHFDYAEYDDGSSLLSRLSHRELNRPAVGVFEWPNSSMRVRPLPTGSEDQTLPPPSLIFHSECPEDVTTIKKLGFRGARIGYNGVDRSSGQMMLLHEDLMGLDVRYCPRMSVSSTFSEAQESLLSGSMQELQSTNVLVSKTEDAKSDERIGRGDCWVEVRANLKRPPILWQRSKKSSRKQKIAKIPDLPYE